MAEEEKTPPMRILFDSGEVVRRVIVCKDLGPIRIEVGKDDLERKTIVVPLSSVDFADNYMYRFASPEERARYEEAKKEYALEE